MSDDEVLFSESLLEDEEQSDEEAERAETYLDAGEKLLAVIEGNVDGESSLNRLALTEKRVIFYPRSEGLLSAFKKTSATSFADSQIETVRARAYLLLLRRLRWR